jgi:NACalpha-BTF3-like transcription factor
MNNTNNIEETDITFVQSQTGTEYNVAWYALLKYNGDIVNAIMDLTNYNSNNDKVNIQNINYNSNMLQIINIMETNNCSDIIAYKFTTEKNSKYKEIISKYKNIISKITHTDIILVQSNINTNYNVAWYGLLKYDGNIIKTITALSPVSNSNSNNNKNILETKKIKYEQHIINITKIMMTKKLSDIQAYYYYKESKKLDKLFDDAIYKNKKQDQDNYEDCQDQDNYEDYGQIEIEIEI